MGLRRRVRVAKCQLLVTSAFVLLLGLCVAAMATLTYFGAHFAVISRAAKERDPHEAALRWAFCSGLALAALLALGALLGAVAAAREAGGLMAAAFLCFALAFCALVQVAFWRLRSPTQVEDAALDAYDLAYDGALRRSPAAPGRELVAIQDAFLCCGKSSRFRRLGPEDAHLCPGRAAGRQDCLQAIGALLRTHASITSVLTAAGLAAMVYALLLTAFLCFAIRAGHSLHRRGSYALEPRATRRCTAPSVPRARGSWPEPGVYRRSPGGLRCPLEAESTQQRPVHAQAAPDISCPTAMDTSRPLPRGLAARRAARARELFPPRGRGGHGGPRGGRPL